MVIFSWRGPWVKGQLSLSYTDWALQVSPLLDSALAASFLKAVFKYAVMPHEVWPQDIQSIWGTYTPDDVAGINVSRVPWS